MSKYYKLDFEKPLEETERRIETIEDRLRRATAGGVVQEADLPTDQGELAQMLADLRRSYQEQLAQIYAGLSPVHVVRVARHPDRPQTRDYIERICKDFCELHGDRRYGDRR